MNNNKKNLKFNSLKFLATWLYSGKSPFAPGTCGSLATLPFVYIISSYWGIYGVLAFAIVVSIAGIPIDGVYAKELNKEDRSEARRVGKERVSPCS